MCTHEPTLELCRKARRSSYLVDWLVFHEGLLPPSRLPDNVRFTDLGAGGLSQLMGLKMGEELGLPVRNASLLIRSMRFMLEKWPRPQPPPASRRPACNRTPNLQLHAAPPATARRPACNRTRPSLRPHAA